MTCHGNKPGKLEECPKCAVLSSCVSKWNKDHPIEEKIYIRDIRNEENDNTNNSGNFLFVRY